MKSISPREIHVAQQCEEPLLATVSDTFLAPSRPKILTGVKNHRWNVASDKFSSPSRSETETDVKKPLLEPVLRQIPSAVEPGWSPSLLHPRAQAKNARTRLRRQILLSSVMESAVRVDVVVETETDVRDQSLEWDTSQALSRWT